MNKYIDPHDIQVILLIALKPNSHECNGSETELQNAYHGNEKIA